MNLFKSLGVCDSNRYFLHFHILRSKNDSQQTTTINHSHSTDLKDIITPFHNDNSVLLLFFPLRLLVLCQQRLQFLSLINHIVQLQFSPSNRTAHIVGDLSTTHLRVQHIRSRANNSSRKQRGIILGIVANRNGQQRECREILQLDSADPTIHFNIPSNAFFVFFA